MTAPGSGEQITAEMEAALKAVDPYVYGAGRLAAALLPAVEAYATRKAAEALDDFAALIDRGPSFPLSPSIFSAMARERAEDARSDALTATPNHGTDAT